MLVLLVVLIVHVNFLSDVLVFIIGAWLVNCCYGLVYSYTLLLLLSVSFSDVC